MTLNKTNLAQICFLLLLFSIFFPIRHTFLTPSAYILGQYSDFTSFSLYLSDILLIITWFLVILPRGELGTKRLIPNSYILILIIWLILDLIWHFKTNSNLNYYNALKYAELIVACGTAYHVFRKTSIKSLFLNVFVIFSSVESILALWQFAIQKSIGGFLHRLGESIIAPNIANVAKIVSSGTTYIRGYGTFPHPNLLSAFLITGIFILLYQILTETKLKYRFFYILGLFINILGLTVSFSRAGYIALAFGLVLFFGFLIFFDTAIGKMRVWLTILYVALALATSFIIFKPFLITRETISDDAVSARLTYAQIGGRMIKANPLFGVGIGESVLHMQQYSLAHLQPWEIQPIHNYFVLAVAELGLPGALIFILIFLSLLFGLIKKLRQLSDFTLVTYNLSLITILCSFLVLMQFDHYFYTLEQTQMLLWIMLGIITAEISKPAPLNWMPETIKDLEINKNPQSGDSPNI